MGKGTFHFLVVSLSLLLIGFYSPASAQQYKYRHITPDDGLPSTTVYRIMQDSKGFIWIATDAGVCRYDGNKFQTFTVKDGLPDNEILGLFEDQEGKIWFSTYKREPAYYFHGKISTLNPDHFFDNTLLQGIVQDKEGYLWFCTSTKGLLKYKDGKRFYYNQQNCLLNNYTVLTQGPDHDIWMATFHADVEIKVGGTPEHPIGTTAHLYGKIDKEPGQLTVFPDSLLSNEQLAIPMEAKDHQLFCYSKTHLVKIKGDSLTEYFSRKIAGKDIFIMKVNEDHHGNLLVATSLGAYRISIKDPSKRECFKPHMSINDVLEDVEGNLWITSLNDGIYFLSQGAQKVNNYTFALDENQTPLNGIIADSINHKLYFGSISGNIYHFVGGTLTAESKPEISKFSSLGGCIRDNDNKLWCLSTYGLYIFPNGNLDVVDREDRFMGDLISSDWVGKEMLFPLKNALRLGAVKAIDIGKDNDIWVSSFCGVYVIKQQRNGYLLKQFHNTRSAGMCYDKKGKVWYGTVNGLCYLDHDTMACVPKEPRGLPGSISDIKVDNNNVLWIATTGSGLYTYHDSVLQHITVNEGLSGDVIYKLHIYENYVLTAGKQGINKIEFDKNSHITKVFPLSINDGLASREVNDIYKEGGKIYAATNLGLSVFDEVSLAKDTLSPLVYLTKVKINENDTLKSKEISLPYNRNNIGIEYVGLFYKNKDIIYRYKMEGVNGAWTETRFTNIQYPTLPPGKYTFIVDARSLQGEWSYHPATISFIIHPPFWKTWWFRILLGLIFVGIVVGISYAVFNYYRNRNEVAKKLVQLEGQALRAQMNPHFIFNSLNAIHDFIADHDQRSAHLYLSRFAALIRRTLDLSRKPVINLAEELETLKLYLELEIMRFKGKIEYEIKVYTDDEPSDLSLPAMLLQPYLENAIRHGLMNKEGKGKLTLEIKQLGDSLHCIITDNGIGRKAADSRGKNLMKHRSHAMDITGERMNIFNEKGQPVKATVKITDLQDNDGNTLGTKVELTIPLNQK